MMATQVGHDHLLVVTFGFGIGFFKFFTRFYQSLLYMVFLGLMRVWVRIFGWRTVEGKLFTSFFQKSLAASAHLQTALVWGNFDVNLEVDGIPSVLENCCAKAGSSGCIGRLSLE